MKKMSKKHIAGLYYFAAACFFISAIIGLVNHEGAGTTNMCLGGAMLCLGSMMLVQSRKESEDATNGSVDGSADGVTDVSSDEQNR